MATTHDDHERDDEARPVVHDPRHRVGGQPTAVSRRTIGFIIGLIFASFAFALLSIPMYRWVCDQLDPGGSSYFNGQTEAYQGVAVDTSRTLTVRFSAQVNRQLPWRFAAAERKIELHPGEKREVTFTAHNAAGFETRGKAVYDIVPPEAAAYFKKVECFCFQDQTLAAGASAELPLIFWFEPDMPDHIKQVTVGYTFFNFDSSLERSRKLSQAPAGAAP